MSTEALSNTAPSADFREWQVEGSAPASPADLEAPLMHLVVRPPLVMQRGHGSYVWDEQEQRYLDFVQGWAVNTFGHSAPEVLGALAEQSNLLITPSPAYHNRPALELARLLAHATDYPRVTFVNSGAEANETAIKLARKWGRKYRNGAYGIVTCEGAFHGRTLATMAASGKPGWEQLFPPYPAGFVKVPFANLDAVERTIGESTVALLVEPIQGEAGAVVPPRGYLAGLRELADRHGLLLMFDEVQTGCGRTGRLLAQEHAGVRADVITLGKGLGAGLPISAVLANERAACFDPGDSGSTHGGNPLAAQVGCAVLRALTAPGFLDRVRQQAQLLDAALARLATAFGGAHARGEGLLRALVFERPLAEALRDECLRQGLLVNAARPTILRFMPQLRVSAQEISEMEAKLTAAHARVVG